ncbi:hypothetical protein GQ44DRAFT_48578 [Phaeosphaeriaceae sp. PMI808]|nr:hypothetical protein GQ44DRAFT_48578 [Phaeosphaeriaceae sp. PMI808]
MYSISDLRNLGFVLFDRMEGFVLSDEKRNCELVKAQRKANKVFGLTSAERWSGCKQLMDFSDDVFSEERSLRSKFTRPHWFISAKRDHRDCLRRCTELVTLECFSLFVPS